MNKTIFRHRENLICLSHLNTEMVQNTEKWWEIEKKQWKFFHEISVKIQMVRSERSMALIRMVSLVHSVKGCFGTLEIYEKRWKSPQKQHNLAEIVLSKKTFSFEESPLIYFWILVYNEVLIAWFRKWTRHCY